MLVDSVVMHGPIMVVGATGQTGSYLCHRLVKSGYAVTGTSRDLGLGNRWRLAALDVQASVEMEFMAPADFSSVYTTLDSVRPAAVFFLAGQSSVGASFQRPYETLESIAVAVQNMLEAIRLLGLRTRFINSASSDMFGNQPGASLDEDSPMRPVSPYGVAKMASYWTTVQYRTAFGVNAFNTILSNHESPLRGENFVSRKIVTQVKELAAGTRESLELANADVERDWLWAGDVADALAQIISVDTPGDFVIASGESHTIGELVYGCAHALGIAGPVTIQEDPEAVRPSDIPSVSLNPGKFKKATGWAPRVSFSELTRKLVEGEL